MIFNKLFLSKTKRAAALYPMELLSGNASFTPWSGKAYANDIYRAAVDAIARNAGKLKGTHFTQSGELRQQVDGRINRLLQVQPNPYMNAYDMIYKTVTQLILHNNAFIYIRRENGNVVGFYPITESRVEFLEDTARDLYCRFYFQNGSSFVFNYGDVIHLRRHFNGNDLLGDSNDALYPALELAHTQNEGIVNAIKSGASIRGILRFEQLMNTDKLREESKKFTDQYLSMNNSGGLIAVDQKMSYSPITSNPVNIDSEQIRAIQTKIYNYLGISEKIVNSSYTEDEWCAFYESTIEPIAVQLSLEFTRKIFTEREQAFGNRIIFESSRLQFASNSTKVNVIKELVPYGILTINQALEILNLPAVEDGDRRLQTLNVVNAQKADQYQIGGTENDE